MKKKFILILLALTFSHLYGAAAMENEMLRETIIPGNFCPKTVLVTDLLTSGDARTMTEIMGRENFLKIVTKLKSKTDTDAEKYFLYASINQDIAQELNTLEKYALLVKRLAKMYSEMGISYCEFLVNPALFDKFHSAKVTHITDLFIAVQKAVIEAEKKNPIVMTPLVALDRETPVEKNMEYAKYFRNRQLFNLFGGFYFVGNPLKPIKEQKPVFEKAKSLELFCGADLGNSGSEELDEEEVNLLGLVHRVGGANFSNEEIIQKLIAASLVRSLVVASCQTYFKKISSTTCKSNARYINQKMAHIGDPHDSFTAETDPQTEFTTLKRLSVVTLLHLYESDMHGIENAFFPKERTHLRGPLKEKIKQYYKKAADIKDSEPFGNVLQMFKAGAASLFS